MKSKTMLLIAAHFGLLAASLVAAPSDISKEHSQALDRWLQSRNDLRLAVDNDCQCDRELNWMRDEPSNQNYQPYYLSSDFNEDGHHDFAVVAVNKSDASKKFLVVFNGPVSAGSEPAFIGPADGILVLSRASSPPQRLLVGRPYFDAAVLEPLGNAYRLVWREP